MKIYLKTFIFLLLSTVVGIFLYNQRTTSVAPTPLKEETTKIITEDKTLCEKQLESEPEVPVIKYDGIPKAVDFSSNPAARLFRTVIKGDASSGPNYAGHFTFASWGCGTSCFQYAIIDSVTGKIVKYQEEPVIFTTYPPSYDLNNRVLIINQKDSYFNQDGKILQDKIRSAGFETGLDRAYYAIGEEKDGYTPFDLLCSENVLSGVYEEPKD